MGRRQRYDESAVIRRLHSQRGGGELSGEDLIGVSDDRKIGRAGRGCGPEQAAQREGKILCGQRGTIGPDQSLTQVKGIGQPVKGDLPAFGAGSERLAGVIQTGQAFKGIFNDGVGAATGSKLRVDGLRLFGKVIGKGFDLFLSAAGGQEKKRRAEQQRGNLSEQVPHGPASLECQSIVRRLRRRRRKLPVPRACASGAAERPRIQGIEGTAFFAG